MPGKHIHTYRHTHTHTLVEARDGGHEVRGARRVVVLSDLRQLHPARCHEVRAQVILEVARVLGPSRALKREVLAPYRLGCVCAR